MSQAKANSNAATHLEDASDRVTKSMHNVQTVAALCATAAAYASENDAEGAAWIANLMYTLDLAREQLEGVAHSLDNAGIAIYQASTGQ